MRVHLFLVCFLLVSCDADTKQAANSNLMELSSSFNKYLISESLPQISDSLHCYLIVSEFGCLPCNIGCLKSLNSLLDSNVQYTFITAPSRLELINTFWDKKYHTTYNSLDNTGLDPVNILLVFTKNSQITDTVYLYKQSKHHIDSILEQNLSLSYTR